MSRLPTASAPRAWIVGPPQTREVRVWGLTPGERLRRSLRSAGCAEVECIAYDADVPTPAGEALVCFRGDAIFDPRLVEALLTTPNAVLCASGDESPVAAHVDAAHFADAVAALRAPDGAADLHPELRRVAPDELVPAYIASLRKAQPPYALTVRAEDVPNLERMLFGGAYKTVTDIVTKWAWPVPAAAVTRVLARRGVHPNTVTIASWILATARR